MTPEGGAETRLASPAVDPAQPPAITATIRKGRDTPSTTLEALPRAIRIAWAPGEDGDFQVEGEIGRGAMGVVYTARQISCRRHVVIKTLAESHDDEAGRSAFLREARVTAGLEHPSIPTVYEVGIDQHGRPFYVCEWVTGQSWASVIRERDLDDNLAILLRVCDAVAYAHSRRVLHRDLKPDNVMLGSFGEVLVMDWGLATDFYAGSSSRRVAAISRHGGPPAEDEVIAGSPGYMAPEMAAPRGERLDQRSDVYLLGAILFEILTGRPPHAGASVSECLRNAAANRIRSAAADHELMRVARTAMATAKAERYRDVGELVAAIRACRDHREADELLDGASHLLAETADLAAMYQAERLAKRAQALWPESDLALELVARARERVVDHYLERGLPEEAEAAVTDELPGAEHLRRRIADLHAHLARRRRRRAALGLASGVAALLLVGLMVVLARGWQARQGSWELVRSDDFATAEAATGVTSEQFSAFHLGESGLHLKAGALVWVDRPQVRGSVRVTVTVRWPERVDGLEILLNAARGGNETTAHMPPGFGCQFGGFGGDICLISRQDEARLPSSSWSRHLPLEAGRTYRLRFQHLGDELSLWVDGERVLTRREALPLPFPAAEHIGLRSWSEDVEILALEVERRVLPRSASPLIGADELVAQGLLEAAAGRYAELAADYADSHLAEQAWLRCGLALVAVDALGHPLLERARRRLEAADPVSWARLESARAVALWEAGELDAALLAAERCLAHDADSRVAIGITAAGRPPGITPAHGRRLLELLARGPEVATLDCSELGLTDLAPLAGMSLVHLRAEGNRIDDCSSLAGMPLTFLSLGDNRLTTIAGLAGMPLRHLTIDGNRISDIGPLAGAPLQRLDMRDNRIADLTPLAGMPLRELHAMRNRIESLEALAGLPLEVVQVAFNPLTDLTGLDSPALREFNCLGCELRDLGPLPVARLERLTIAGTEITDLDPLIGAPLRTLNVGYSAVTRIPADHAWTRLRDFTCSGTAIADLDPLAGLPLAAVHASRTPIRDLTPVLNPALRVLVATDCPVTHLDFARRAPQLRVLDLSGCPVVSFGDLGERAPFLCLVAGHQDPVAVAARAELVHRWQRSGWESDRRGARILLINRLLDAYAVEAWDRVGELVARHGRPHGLLFPGLIDRTELEELLTQTDCRLLSLDELRQRFEQPWIPEDAGGYRFHWVEVPGSDEPRIAIDSVRFLDPPPLGPDSRLDFRFSAVLAPATAAVR